MVVKSISDFARKEKDKKREHLEYVFMCGPDQYILQIWNDNYKFKFIVRLNFITDN